ncbi:MAG: hypothetical protein KDK34_10725 [Leptospiraceae bacterium]|nr:hypothetical protein [Leptospiraceae bacterium]
MPSIAYDATNQKLLFATLNQANGNRGHIFVCNKDGTGCTHADISGGAGANSGHDPQLLVDSTNSRLLIVTRNQSGGSRPLLLRCNMDGTGCTNTDISGGAPANSGQQPKAILDTVNNKILVVTRHQASNSKPNLFRCNLDGTGCTFTDISATAGNNSGYDPDVVIDTINNKLLTVTRDQGNGSLLALFRCDLDGTGCTYTDISAGAGANSAFEPSAAIDTSAQKLMVVTRNQSNADRLTLFRCDLDGTGCTFADASDGAGASSGFEPALLIESGMQTFAVVARNNGNADKLSFFRCNMSVSSCQHYDISSGKGAGSGKTPSAMYLP